MSVQATTWVWEHSQAEGNARLVLLAIADAANREGENAWVSANTIAKMCRIGHRTAQRKIAELMESGELEKMGSRGEKQATVYRIPGVQSGKPLRQNDVRQNDAYAKSGKPLRQNDVRQNDAYAKSGKPLRQNEHTATPPMAYNPINPSITNVIHPNSDAPSAQPTHNRGTRITEDFWPAQKHIDKIKAMKPGLNLDLEHTKFMNYWLSATGRNATKKDWGRTWENWMLNAKAGNDYKPGWQKRLEYNAQMNQQYQHDPGADFLRSIEQ